MQSRYVGDVGDFGKYGLLRALAGVFPHAAPRLRLGVVWYLVSEHEANNDGKHDNYLNKSGSRSEEAKAKKYRCCDQVLHQALAEIRRRDVLALADVHDANLFGDDSRYFEDELTYKGVKSGGRAARDKRLERRRDWFARAFAATAGCQLVFVDPDNGLEAASISLHKKKAPKYVYFEELSQLHARGQSLVVYHHLGRNGDHPGQIRQKAALIDKRLGTQYPTIALHYRRGTARAFFVVPATEEHDRILRMRTAFLLAGEWGQRKHFALDAGQSGGTKLTDQ